MEPTLGQQPGTAPMGPYTWDDFVALDEDDRRELIDGWLIEVEVPTNLHEYIVACLIGFIASWARANKAGKTFASGYKVKITPKRGVMPDIQFFRKGNLPTDAVQALVDGRPDLAVEVISPSSRSYDRVTKLNSYAKIDVPEYWLVDPEARVLERFILRDGSYVIDPHGEKDIFRPETFPGLEIPLAELWQISDEEPSTT